jgi:hypothetical protein
MTDTDELATLRARVAELEESLHGLCGAYEALCADTGMPYHQSPGSYYSHARATLEEKP